MADPYLVAVVTKNSREEVRVMLDEYHGAQLVDVRTWADYSAGTVECRGPTKKGIALGIEKLPDLVDALVAAKAEAVRRGLLTEG